MALATLGYTITFHDNGGSGGPGSLQGVETGPGGALVVVTLSSLTPSWAGRSFRGWGTASNASSASYGPGNGYVFTLPENGLSITVTVHLYAVWGYAIYYLGGNANGVTNLPSTQYKIHNITLTLSSTKPKRSKVSNGSYTVTFNANGGSCSTSSLNAKKYTTYPFVNWKCSYDEEYYNAGGSYTANRSVTMQALWTTGSSVEEIELPTPTRNGYYCTGWYTAASGGTKKGEPGGSFTPSANITLYALWSNVILNSYNVYVVKSGSPLTLEKYNTYVVVSGALQKYNVKIGVSP